MENPFKKEELRTSIIIIVGFIILAYILFVEKMFLEAKVYGAFGILTVLGLLFFKSAWKKSKKRRSLEDSYLGVNKKWGIGILAGAGFALAFILITNVKIFAGIAQLITPQVALSLFSSAVVVILIAPIFEENFFTSTIASYLRLFLPDWLVAILKGFFFAGSHYFAYVIIAGTTLANALGSFVGAGVFGFVSFYIAKYFGIEASQTGHGIFNLWNFNKMFHFLSVTGGAG